MAEDHVVALRVVALEDDPVDTAASCPTGFASEATSFRLSRCA